MKGWRDIGAARVRIEAMKRGWTRDPVARLAEDGVPVTTFRGPGGLVFPCRAPESLQPRDRQLTRAWLVSLMAGECPGCGGVERPAGELRTDAVGLLVTQLSPVTGGETGIEHEPDCPIAPGMMMLAAANPELIDTRSN
jgi:hypothetical protein